MFCCCAFKHFDYVNLCIEELETAIFLLAKKFQPQIDLLKTIAGISDMSAIRIIAEIGCDMSVFPSAKHLCSWAGLTPQNNESAGKKKSVHISRAGVWLKPLMIQVALSAVKAKSNPYFAYKYNALTKRRGKKRAVIAIARMILTSIYHMLSDNVPFNEELYQSYYHEQTKKINSRSFKKILSLLSEQGFSVVNNNGELVNSLTG